MKRVNLSDSGRLRITDEPAFVLHAWPYKETSLVVDVLTRHYGRVGLVARGARRRHSAMRGVLLAFQPLLMGWTGTRGAELHTMTRVEWQGGLKPLEGEALLCGFYLNELLQRLLARDDAHEALFDHYVDTLGQLASGLASAPVLRVFEVELLREAGYGLVLTHSAGRGDAVEAGGWYRYEPETGPVRVSSGVDRPIDGPSAAPVVCGKTLLDIDRGDYSDPMTLTQSKQLMRHMLHYHMAGQPLFTRQMLIDLQTL